MKKAYIKALKVIRSCNNSSHIMGAYNFIYNFRILFGKLTGCNELTKKLMEKCALQRKIVEGRNN
tara:strand:+ start:2204 stop:2398 length:195 start_codon:yes stop_codon:yes gene_type:complete